MLKKNVSSKSKKIQWNCPVTNSATSYNYLLYLSLIKQSLLIPLTCSAALVTIKLSVYAFHYQNSYEGPNIR